MASPIETVILNLKNLGAFEFLMPFLLTSAIFYGLLRRSKLFGEPERNVAVNGVVAIVAAFMVWSYPILAGVSIQQQFSTFMFYSVSALLVIIVGLLITSMFLPEDLPKQLGERFKSRGVSIIAIAGILIGGGILIASGLVGVFIPQIVTVGGPSIDDTTILTLAVLIILGVGVAAVVMPSGKKSS